MARRKQKGKRSLSSLPRGLPQRSLKRKDGPDSTAFINPFESITKSKKPKYEVHNRNLPKEGSRQNSLAKSIQRRQTQLKSVLDRNKKVNMFEDKRIGEYNKTMSHDEQMLARIVKQRSQRSKRTSKFALNDDDDGTDDYYDNKHNILTHKGKAIDYTRPDEDHVVLENDDEAGNGDLEAIDTELHFGGGNFDRQRQQQMNSNPYGPSGGNDNDNLIDVYTNRKTELDDLIARRKVLKAEKVKSKETQNDVFEKLDESFKELASLLQFRDKDKERKDLEDAKISKSVPEDDQEMLDWDKEIKTYMFERKVAATDRTKTPEEIAKEESEKLHELETKRLARMNGDFTNDDVSDIESESSDDENEKRKDKKKQNKVKKIKRSNNPDEIDDDSYPDDADSHNDKEDDLEVRFTADGLVYVDKDGNIVDKSKSDRKRKDDNDEHSSSDDDEDDESEEEESDDDSSDSDDEDNVGNEKVYTVGTRISANYRANDQFKQAGDENWFNGTISGINKTKDKKSGTVTTTYDITYDDNDYENDVEAHNIRALKKSTEEKKMARKKMKEERNAKVKRKKAQEKARQEIPFVFAAPTTLDALHDMIGTYASTGADASLIIQRIHKSNSVRLDKRNTEKMQNFYDVLLRRFVAIGDAINKSGNGGTELGRYNQLDSITKTLYGMSQDSPGCAGAVWSRRLGIFHNAHAKRLRDAQFVVRNNDSDDNEHTDSDSDVDRFSAWPSTGTFLLLRSLGHIFPVTDMRHHIVTPALLLLGQIIVQTPVRSMHDVVMGVLFSGLMIEFTKDAKRIAPEALGFLTGVLSLYASLDTSDKEGEEQKRSTSTFNEKARCPIPSLEAATRSTEFDSVRARVSKFKQKGKDPPKISLEHSSIKDISTMPTAILCAVLQLIKQTANDLGGSLQDAETETFMDITHNLLCLNPKCKQYPLPKLVTKLVADTALAVSTACKANESRMPLTRRTGLTLQERAIKTLAPRMEDPKRYSLNTKDKGKSATQAAIDRARREYKREHKAMSRELRLDASFIENERRKDKERKDSKARSKRHKNFAWLEGEQATMNQQVRLGGGLLSGGGTGAAHAKAKSAKLGIKKGGKF